jgi:peroxiredoxin
VADPVLADDDHSVQDAYFVPEGTGDAFAQNPRNYVIDRDGNLVYTSAQVTPGDMLEAIHEALDE